MSGRALCECGYVFLRGQAIKQQQQHVCPIVDEPGVPVDIDKHSSLNGPEDTNLPDIETDDDEDIVVAGDGGTLAQFVDGLPTTIDDMILRDIMSRGSTQEHIDAS